MEELLTKHKEVSEELRAAWSQNWQHWTMDEAKDHLTQLVEAHNGSKNLLCIFYYGLTPCDSLSTPSDKQTLISDLTKDIYMAVDVIDVEADDVHYIYATFQTTAEDRLAWICTDLIVCVACHQFFFIPKIQPKMEDYQRLLTRGDITVSTFFPNKLNGNQQYDWIEADCEDCYMTLRRVANRMKRK